jgi:DNA replication protein DnaC
VSATKAATVETEEPSVYQQLREHLAYLQMTAAAEHLAPVLDRALKNHLSATQVLETLAEFDFDFQPGVDRRVVAELSTLRFVEEKRTFRAPQHLGYRPIVDNILEKCWTILGRADSVAPTGSPTR